MRANDTSQFRRAFARADLIASVASLGLVVVWAFTFAATSRGKSEATVCASRLRALQRAVLLYAADHHGAFPYNMGLSAIDDPKRRPYLWAPNLMTWEARWPSTTNRLLLREASLARFLEDPVNSFKCPTDRMLSPAQVRAGWQSRLRSYSMNGFVGRFDLGPVAGGERSWVSTNFKQFLRTSDPRNPAGAFVFLEEHPDSINDGIFINQPVEEHRNWGDIPASFHDRSINLSSVDGHVDTHRWKSQRSVFPVRFTYPPSTFLDAAGQSDYRWLLERMCER